jgi:hypothetical protein
VVRAGQHWAAITWETPTAISRPDERKNDDQRKDAEADRKSDNLSCHRSLDGEPLTRA